jgi:hypothetical protein
MKFKITKIGVLEIERAGEWKQQICPYDSDYGDCGDWCPLFDDSHIYTEKDDSALGLCTKTYFGKRGMVIDERKYDE